MHTKIYSLVLLSPIIACLALFSTAFKVGNSLASKHSIRNTVAISRSEVLTNNILFEQTFEGTNPLSTVYFDGSATYSGTISGAAAFAGTKSLRLELRDTDPEVKGGTRSEIFFAPEINKNRWYSFAVYFPSGTYTRDKVAESISQWHQWPDEDLGEPWRSPTLGLMTKDDRFRLDIDYNAARVCDAGIDKTSYDLGVVPKDQWVEFIFHIIHSYSSDGLVQVYQNGKLVVDHKGGNMYNDAKLPYWKFGIYKWSWNGTGTTDVSKRIFYYDNIRRGNEKATFATMTSTPTILSYTVVNGDTGADIKTFSDNATISLSAIGTKNINIRANGNSATTGSVNVRMWGSGAKNYTDNATPYCLFWESSSSTSQWATIGGTYTFRATPYSGLNATGTAGTALTASLTIEK